MKDAQLFSALELAEIAGKSTGIVTTARVTHATPAAAYASSSERDWENDADLSREAVTEGCEDIASQLIAFEKNLKTKTGRDGYIDGLEVVMGGGRRNFNGESGRRRDGRNLTGEWEKMYPRGVYLESQHALKKINISTTEKLFGLFNRSHMRYEADRAKSAVEEPSLSEMTKKAISLLKKNKKGFFLVVEAGRIDHGHHESNAYRALSETVEFSSAIESALGMVDIEETLVLVTADHSHVMTMAGYPTRGNPILGKVIGNDSFGNPRKEYSRDREGLSYTTIGYINGPGMTGHYTSANGDIEEADIIGRVDIEKLDTTAENYYQESFIPLDYETHGGEDVLIYARGPGASLVSGTHEQNVIFHIMNYAGDLTNLAHKAGVK